MILRGISIVMVLCWTAASSAAELGEDWTVSGGDWGLTREIVPIYHQRQSEGQAVAFRRGPRGEGNVWRAYVKLSQGTEEAGLWVRDGRDQARGLRALIGQYSPVGGFLLGAPDGTVVWQDKYAPWQPYHCYVVELVVEDGQGRVQMFEGDQKTLVSQSPWIPLEALAAKDLELGLFTREGAARFFAPHCADQPLSPIVDDPPNQRRLIAEHDSPWLVVGPGNWMWTTSRRERLRQYADVERTWAFHHGIRGSHRQWECRLRVDPGTKGAGILFQANPERTQGFIAWLGGKYGAGSLMLYQYQPETQTRWSSGNERWHYDTEYLLRGETRPGQARVQLLQSDGTTVIADSSWIDVGDEQAAREGCLGLHVWSGRAEFWGFSETTRTDQTVAPPAAQAMVDLGHGWLASGGRWRWDDADRERLHQQSDSPDALALNLGIQGSQGTWRCRLRLDGQNAAGLVFQANRDQTEGFVALVAPGRASLKTLHGSTLWEDAESPIEPGQEYVLEGIVTTDRVALRVLAADGTTVLVASPDIYVSESNNTRAGYLGLTTHRTPAEFRGWELRK
jgi:hypothetical protein